MCVYVLVYMNISIGLDHRQSFPQTVFPQTVHEYKYWFRNLSRSFFWNEVWWYQTSKFDVLFLLTWVGWPCHYIQVGLISSSRCKYCMSPWWVKEGRQRLSIFLIWSTPTCGLRLKHEIGWKLHYLQSGKFESPKVTSLILVKENSPPWFSVEIMQNSFWYESD